MSLVMIQSAVFCLSLGLGLGLVLWLPVFFFYQVKHIDL